MRSPKSPAAGLALLLAPGFAWAHHFMGGALPRTFGEGFLSGLGHPLIGLDHLAFIVAVGFFLGAVPRGMLAIAALIAGSLGGAALHLAGVALPAAEAGVALSVLLAGALLLVRPSIGLAALACGMALAGVLHGYAYAESIFGAEPAPLAAYLAGFSLVQLAIAALAGLLHRRLLALRGQVARAASSLLGGAAAAVGALVLLAPLLAA